MTKFGILGAMQEEVETLLALTENKKELHRAGSVFYEGTLEGIAVVIVKCGVGKVNAAICTQILCDMGVTHLVNTGVAGSLNPELDILDLLISRDAMHHDVDATLFGYAYGQVPQMNTVTFPADQTLMDYAFAAAEAVNPGHSKFGRVTTGDRFVASREEKAQILRCTRGDCTEMEGAAIAQTAYRNGIPFVILRAISDKADDSARMDYPTFERIAAHRCAEITIALARQLKAAE